MPSLDRGLLPDGTIRREGDLDRVSREHRPLVTAWERAMEAAFSGRMHSLYLYGSVPRGTARRGVSDLDVLAVLHDQVTTADRALGTGLAGELQQRFPVVSEVGLLLEPRDHLMDPAERLDGGFFVACLCTWLAGTDLATELGPYRPTADLARATNGDVADRLAGHRAALDALLPGDDTTACCRAVGRRLVRCAFSLVMSRWGGWTSDPTAMVEAVASFYPDQRADLTDAAALGWDTPDDPARARRLLDGLGAWLVDAYAAEIGLRPPP